MWVRGAMRCTGPEKRAGGQDEEGVSQARVRVKVRRGWLRDGPGSCVTLTVGLFDTLIAADQLVCVHSLVLKQSSNLNGRTV